VMECSDFFQRVRERIMPDVVKERGGSHNRLLLLADRDRIARLAKERQGASRKVMSAERVLEARVGRAWIYEICPPELAYVPKALKDFSVDEVEGQLIDSDVVPDRVAQNFE